MHPCRMVGTDYERLGRAVSARRSALRMTQKEFVDGTGITVKTLQRLENGERVRGDTLSAIDEAARWEPGGARAILAGGEPTPRGMALRVVTGGKPDEQALAAMLRAVYDSEGYESFRDEYARFADRYGAEVMADVRTAFAELSDLAARDARRIQ